jgi:hypothetical protein
MSVHDEEDGWVPFPWRKALEVWALCIAVGVIAGISVVALLSD